MASFIPDEKISEIKNAADLVDVVSEVVLLKKSGKNYLGLCPFHSEKTPSFTVSPEKQIFYCFGCHTGGNIFSFLMKQDGLSFPDAVRLLARRYGIEVPTAPVSPEQKRQISQRESLLAVNRKAMDFFHQTLIDRTEGKQALNYLQSRKLEKKSIDDFCIGYAPGEWDRLVRHLSREKIPTRIAERAGLILSKRDRGGYYDRFRNRIIFPIFNLSHQTIGFGGRVMDDSLPKYLNSPESAVFNKSRSLYGLNRAKGKCRESGTVFIVEGYFDLLALHRHGIENAVATLGTGLTREHIRLLKGFATQFYLVYDSDDSGRKAAERIIGIFMEEEIHARIVVLPPGHDPDSYLFKFGPDAFGDVVSKALGIMSFLIDATIRKHGLSVEGKIRIISDLKNSVAQMDDRVARSLYVKKISERVGVDETAVLEKMREASSKKPSRPLRINRFNPAKIESKVQNKRESKLEKKIISMMLQYPDIIAEVMDRHLLEHFEDAVLKSVGELIGKYQGPADQLVSELVTTADDEEKKQMINSLAIGEDPWEKESCIKLMAQFESIKFRQKNGLLKKIKTAEKQNDNEMLLALLKEKQNQAKKNKSSKDPQEARFYGNQIRFNREKNKK